MSVELCAADLYVFLRLEINYQFHLLSWPLFFFFFFRSMYSKTIIEWGFCDIQNKQGLARDISHNPYLDLDYSGYHKNLAQ